MLISEYAKSIHSNTFEQKSRSNLFSNEHFYLKIRKKKRKHLKEIKATENEIIILDVSSTKNSINQSMINVHNSASKMNAT